MREAEEEKAARTKSGDDQSAEDGSETQPIGGPPGDDFGTMGRSGLAGDLPELDTAADDTARSAEQPHIIYL